MKLEDIDAGDGSGYSFAGLLEKIEVLRSALRWSNRLERPEIQRLLGQCNALRDDVVQFSRVARIVAPASGGDKPDRGGNAARRQGLIDRHFAFEGVFGESPKLLEAMEIAEKAAPTDLPVLIDGESGTGKELMAKVIHANSRRANKEFVSVNCGAIPESLIESELFGHKKGAFTGAASDRKGKFESADSGTIFLDEIGELPLQGQVKLLRVLQSRELQRVGSDTVTRVDVRVVAATNRNLLKMSRDGSFREDLYYRLSVINVTLPPLRERRDEIPLLIDFFCLEAAESLRRQPVRFSPALQGFLLNYAFPGNVRELRNIVYRLTCLAGRVADIEHLPESVRPDVPGEKKAPFEQGLLERSLSDVKREASDAAEKIYLEEGLRKYKGKLAEFARQIEMNRSHLWTLLRKHGIDAETFRPPRKGAVEKGPTTAS